MRIALYDGQFVTMPNSEDLDSLDFKLLSEDNYRDLNSSDPNCECNVIVAHCDIIGDFNHYAT